MAGNVFTSTLVTIPTANFTRPANTTAYAAGQLLANSVTAASVVPLSWSVGLPAAASLIAAPTFYVAGVRLLRSKADVTNASFRIHLYSVIPTIATTGDAGVYGSVVSGMANWIGSYDGTMVALHADGAAVVCTPTEGVIGPQTIASGSTVYGLIEARAAVSPASGETFTALPLIEQNGL